MIDEQMKLGDDEIIKALECCVECDTFGGECREDCPFKEVDDCTFVLRRETLDLIKRQQADKDSLEIELQAMRNAANSYKSKVKTLEMDNAQLHSDIVNANQNLDHIEGLWKSEKEKVEKAKQKVINVCKELQKAKAEIEELKADKKRLEDDLWNAEINRGFAEQQIASFVSVNDVLEELKHTLVINNEGNTDFFDYEYTLETIELFKNRGVIFNV